MANAEHGGITAGGQSKVNTPFGGELAGAGKQEMETREEDVFDNESAKVSSTCFVGTMAFVEKIGFICDHLLCFAHYSLILKR